jgi:hypothetical protein
LLAGVLLLVACFKSSGSSTPLHGAAPAIEIARSDHSATLADPLGFLPIDSELVLSLDAEQLRRSEIWRQLEPKLLASADQGLGQFKRVCGFDPVTSIRGISIGMNGLGANASGVIVVSGLDRARLTACARKNHRAGQTTIALDGEFLTVRDAQATMVATFVDASTIVALVGPTATRESLQAVLSGGAPLRSSPTFVEMFGRLDIESSLWVLINGNSKIFQQAAALGMKPKSLIGSLSLASGLDAMFRMRLETAAEAQQLSQLAQGQLHLASSFFEKLEVTTDSADVVVIAQMSETQLQNLVSLLGGMLGGGGP